ncbi:hypothetical protein C0Q70_05302 [Pomacea canaliculata]|uniref:VWFA domain-containing protein n=1 Tax=Pomacea canaliculata TaxID=400727 RepID=A0A2T7PKW1_POMCA|nr:hypothetical protein C0Q70_05302 [Pomacea canaliculata]
MGGGWRYPLLSTGDSSEEMSVLHSPGYSSYARAGYNTGYNNGYNTRHNHNYPGQPSISGYNPGYGRHSWYGYSNHPVGIGWGQQNSGGSAMSRTTWGHGLGSKSGDSSAQGGASAGRFAGGDSSSEDDTTSFLGGLLAGLGGGGSSNKERYPLTSEILARAGGGNDGSQSADVSLAGSDDEGDVSDDVAEVVVGGRQAEDRGDSNSSEGDDVGDNDSSDRSGLHVASYPTINCQAAMDVAVLVDLSQRASAPDVTQVRTSLGDLVDNLHVQSGGRHMAVMTYGSQVRLTSALSGNAGQLKTDIARLTPAGGAADMALALQSMRDLLTSQGRPSACVLITDERATSSQMAARQAALARMAGIQMLVVAVGQDLGCW